jgi:hypothetical protein
MLFFIVLSENHEATHGLEGYKFVRYPTEKQARKVAKALTARYGTTFYVMGCLPEEEVSGAA